MFGRSTGADVKLIHYGTSPVIDRRRTYVQSIDWKPNGLWLSDESGGEDTFGWSCFCADADMTMGSFVHEVDIDATASILILRTVEEVRTFHKGYARRMASPYSRSQWIDWDAVAREWCGIIITPYLWEIRLDNMMRWYQTWDCASGCVWDLSVIVDSKCTVRE